MAENKLSPDEIERLRGLVAPFGVAIPAGSTSEEVVSFFPYGGPLWSLQELENVDPRLTEMAGSDLMLVLKWMEMARVDLEMMTNKLREALKTYG